MNIFKNDLKRDLQCQIKENAAKQDKIVQLNHKVDNLEARLEKATLEKETIKTKYDQLEKNYIKLLEVVNVRCKDTKRK